MNVIILGAKGMLGSSLIEIFHELSPTPLDREDLDITDKKAVLKKFKELKPDLVINAAAYTDVEGSEDNKELAMDVNGYAVGFIAEAAGQIGARVAHYSTDYVFGGTRRAGYNETDPPAKEPMNVYGVSKLLGEQELVKNTQNYILIRTSWLFGKNGKNFPDTMLRLADERDELRVVNDQHGKPTYVKDLAQATLAISSQGIPSGIYHLVNEGSATWYEVALKVMELAGKKTKIIPVTSKEFPTKAKRPKWSILNNNKFIKLRPWQEALEEHLNS